MYKKYFKYLIILSLCSLFVLSWLSLQEPTATVTKKSTNNLQTVIFKDEQDTLIPVVIDIQNEDNQENNYRGIIEAMKSTD